MLKGKVTKMKRKISIRLTALILSAIIAIISLPLSAFALESNSAFTNSKDKENSSTLVSDVGDEELGLQEVVSLRDKFTKHYMDEYGNRYAVIFSDSVHYKDDNTWVEIDNSLLPTSDGKKYVSKNNRFKTEFSKSSSDSELVSISDGEYSLSWTVLFEKADGNTANEKTETNKGDIETALSAVQGMKKTDGEVNNRSSVEDISPKKRTKETISDIGKALSGIRYNKVFNNSVDLNYTVLHGKVEEDIILSSKGAFTSYMLKLNTNGLSAIKNSDNSIYFVNDSQEIIFTLAAPWMRDASFSVSDSIAVELFEKNGTTYISYTPNEEWLNDENRVYPVLIDPSFTTYAYTSNCVDTYVYSGDSASSTRPSETYLKVGNISGNTYYAYVKMQNFPDIENMWSIKSASFDFYTYDTGTNSLALYEANSSWSPTTITYANQPSSALIKSGITGVYNGAYSKYSFDLSSFIDDVEYSYSGGFFAYLNSSDFNGFKIAYTTSTQNSSVQIASSEHSSYRPSMTIEYDYYPYGALEDGAVYNFVNSASGKYLTVDGGNTANGTNIYQYTNNNSLSQSFRLDYDETSEAYRIRAMCSDNGEGSVVRFVYNSAALNASGYRTTNVYLYRCMTAATQNQEWLIYSNSSGTLFKIVSRADPNLALTAYGTANGTSDGTTSTSSGNVYLAEFTGASNQWWQLKSGGIRVYDTLSIKEAADIGESFTVNESTSWSWSRLVCPATEFGDRVSWSSSNTNAIAVNSIGSIVVKKAGTATVTATITHSDGTYDSYSTTFYVALADGIYYFNNAETEERIEFLGIDSYNAGEPITVYDSGTDSAVDRYQIFKIHHLGSGLYSIRSMLDSSMGWKRAGTSLVSNSIGTATDSVTTLGKWRICKASNGYYIYSNNSTAYTVTSPAVTSSSDNIILQSYSSSNTLQHWTLTKVNVTYNGVTIKDKIEYLAIGETFAFTACVYSTNIDINGQNGISWSATNISGTATANSTTGEIVGITKGTVSIVAAYNNSAQTFNSSFMVEINNGWYLYSQPTIHTRSEWGARNYVENRLIERTRQPERIVFHHSADKFSSTDIEEVKAEIRRIQNYHIDDRGKCDIAYHFIIDPSGKIWQGSQIDEYQRGHTTGYFDDIGVLILGDFESRAANLWNPNILNQEQKNSMISISKWLCFEYDLLLIETGDILAPITTHRMLSDTECPGGNAAPWIENDLTALISAWNREQ